MSDQYDLVVIGAGSGGVRAARMAATYGARVAVIEEYRVGGTCVIRGCVPKKLFVYASRFSDLFEISGSFGWTVDAQFDWPTLVANKDKEIARLEAAYVAGLERPGAEVIRDRADNFSVICSIENFDPMGVHTGDSITVAPAMTLTDKEYQRLRDAARAIITEIGVDTGGSNIQFAVNPRDGRVMPTSFHWA